MINFSHMNVTKCPECGCSVVVSESIAFWNGKKRRELLHCNGQKWETRTFLCGYSTQWTPSFSKAKAVDQCRETESYLAKQAAADKKREEIEALKAELHEILYPTGDK